MVTKIVFSIVFCWIIHILLENKKISRHSGKTEKKTHCVGLLFIKLCLNPKCRIGDRFEQCFIVEVRCHEQRPWLRVIRVGCSWARLCLPAVGLCFGCPRNNAHIVAPGIIINTEFLLCRSYWKLFKRLQVLTSLGLSPRWNCCSRVTKYNKLLCVPHRMIGTSHPSPRLKQVCQTEKTSCWRTGIPAS